MNQIIKLSPEYFLVKGGERDIYAHPTNNSKIIKIDSRKKYTRNQNILEYRYYSYLGKKEIDQKKISKCFGFIDTNLGKGLVFEKIIDYDGKLSIGFDEIIKQKKLPVELEIRLLEELKEYLLRNQIVFVDAGLYNILCQEYKKDNYRLVIIDGLGGRRPGFKSNLYIYIAPYRLYKIIKQWKKIKKSYKIFKKNKSDSLYSWDGFSDQPHIIKDKKFKRDARLSNLRDYLKMFLSSIFVLPFAFLTMKLFKGKQTPSYKELIGVGVNLDKGDAQQELIEDLGVENLIIRVFLNDIENIDSYVEFAKSFNKKSKKNIVINIVQGDLNSTKTDRKIKLIFSKFKDISSTFQIGTAINRLKWGFSSARGFIDFFKVAQKVRDEKFPHIKLLGPSVIDFEYYYNVKTMFTRKKISYDKTSALLYVDRRGSPKNRQYGIFNLKNKINLLYALVRLSPKTKSDEIYITEVNWPIKNSAPYAPTSEKECVSLDEYTKFMLEYFQIAKESKKISKIFWHQLIAPGYGLVDNRDGKLIKYPQYFALKELLEKID
jgi:hypothetical protein